MSADLARIKPGSLFVIAYWIGMGLEMAWAAIVWKAQRNPIPGDIVVGLRVVHMVVLIVMALAVMRLPTERRRAASLIQNAGYLHTLFAFAVVMLSMSGSGASDFSVFLAPFGSALFTSILGWLFGGWLTASEDRAEEESLKGAGERVSEELMEFASEIKNAQSEYTDALKRMARWHEELDKQSRDAMSKCVTASGNLSTALNELVPVVTEASKTLGGALGQEFTRSVGSLKARVTELDGALREVGSSAKSAKEYLNQCDALVKEVERVAESLHKRGPRS